MVCQFCGKEISAIRQIRDEDFCSAAHRRLHNERLRKALTDLAAPEPVPTRMAPFFLTQLPLSDKHGPNRCHHFLHDGQRILRPKTWGVSIDPVLAGTLMQFRRLAEARGATRQATPLLHAPVLHSAGLQLDHLQLPQLEAGIGLAPAGSVQVCAAATMPSRSAVLATVMRVPGTLMKPAGAVPVTVSAGCTLDRVENWSALSRPSPVATTAVARPVVAAHWLGTSAALSLPAVHLKLLRDAGDVGGSTAAGPIAAIPAALDRSVSSEFGLRALPALLPAGGPGLPLFAVAAEHSVALPAASALSRGADIASCAGAATALEIHPQIDAAFATMRRPDALVPAAISAGLDAAFISKLALCEVGATAPQMARVQTLQAAAAAASVLCPPIGAQLATPGLPQASDLAPVRANTAVVTGTPSTAGAARVGGTPMLPACGSELATTASPSAASLLPVKANESAGIAAAKTAPGEHAHGTIALPKLTSGLAGPPEPHAADILRVEQTAQAPSTAGKLAGPIGLNLAPAQLPGMPGRVAPQRLHAPIALTTQPHAGPTEPYRAETRIATSVAVQLPPAPVLECEGAAACDAKKMPGAQPVALSESKAAPALEAFAPAPAVRKPNVRIQAQLSTRSVEPSEALGSGMQGLRASAPPPGRSNCTPAPVPFRAAEMVWPGALAAAAQPFEPAVAGSVEIDYHVQRGRLQPVRRLDWYYPRSAVRFPQVQIQAVPVQLDQLVQKAPTKPKAAVKTSFSKRSDFDLWAKGIAAGFAICAFTWISTMAMRSGQQKPVSAPSEAPAVVALSTPPAPPSGGLWRQLRQNIANRATIEIATDFRSSKPFWDGSHPGLGKGWERHPDGYVRPGALSLFSPTLQLTDYRLEFMTQIESKSVGWVVRAHDVQNYYAMKFNVIEPGLRPLISVVRYPVVNGRRGRRVEIPLQVMVHNNRPFRVAMEVRGNRFTASIEGETVDTWTDSSLPRGGVGFFAEGAEKARLYWTRVTNNDDMLGRLCAYLAGTRTQAREQGEQRAFSSGDASRKEGLPSRSEAPLAVWIDWRSRQAGMQFSREMLRG